MDLNANFFSKASYEKKIEGQTSVLHKQDSKERDMVELRAEQRLIRSNLCRPVTTDTKNLIILQKQEKFWVRKLTNSDASLKTRTHRND